ncbi:hypothetical protein NIES4101_27800 (plasmid) [Calothrix sp. NIES-4101]|nr:hypothetical protein NIES4101_27800 [Calothrix sp. NIES-4101]
MGKLIKLVQPTGDLKKEPNKDATLPVPLPVVMVQIKGKYTALDRKLWALLLHLGWDELETKSQLGKWHELEEAEVRRIIRRFSGTKGMNWIWESAQRLTETTVRYVRVDENDKRWKGITSLFTAECPESDERDGIFRYMFPAALIPILKEPERFARLRIQFLLRLKSKYSVTLYQLFEAHVNKRVPVVEVEVEELRTWLKVPEGKLKRWDDFYQKALKPALEEINKNPEEAGFSISFVLKRGGRGGKVQAIKFKINKTASRFELESKILATQTAKETARINTLVPPFRGTTIYDKARKIAHGLDVHVLEQEWREWIIKNDMKIDNPEAHFMAFIKAKIKKLYKQI